MKKYLIAVSLLAGMVSCSNQEKILVVMSKGDANIDVNAKTISATDGAGHVMKNVEVNAEKVSFSISSPAGKATIDLTENGLYVVNVKNDTIIGSLQSYVTQSATPTIVSQEELKHKIDSLQLLTEGKNVSAENHNFFILPNTAVRITGNTDAMIIGPYHQMQSVEKIDGKAPAVYRFFSVKEARETIKKMTALTVAEKK